MADTFNIFQSDRRLSRRPYDTSDREQTHHECLGIMEGDGWSDYDIQRWINIALELNDFEFFEFVEHHC